MKKEALRQQKAGICDPVYKKLIENMLQEHKNDPLRSSLVFLNTFDYSKDMIEDFMEERRIYAEVFEIDRMRKEDRGEYLNCFNDMFGTKQLPVIFLKDTFVGNFQQL